MHSLNVKKLLQEAKKYIKNPDIIVDVFDMTYIWVSDYHCEITGYKKEEQLNISMRKIAKTNDSDTSHMAPEASTPYQRFEKEMIIITKEGLEKNINTEAIVIEFNKQPYLVGKIKRMDK